MKPELRRVDDLMTVSRGGYAGRAVSSVALRITELSCWSPKVDLARLSHLLESGRLDCCQRKPGRDTEKHARSRVVQIIVEEDDVFSTEDARFHAY